MKKTKVPNNNGEAEAITRVEYGCFQEAYDYFNAELFGGKLRPLLITLRAKGRRSLGFFSPQRFAGRQKDETVHELALNSDTFTKRTDEEISSTLVHEMVHAWQQDFGQPSRNRYHNKQWAAAMEQIGLMPSHTGEPGGNRTGQSMDHYVIEGGPFQLAYQKLAASGFNLHWSSRAEPAKTRNSKTKFTCSICGQNAWAKPDAELDCGKCKQGMQPAMQSMQFAINGQP
jgi:SprT-like family